MQRNKVLIVSSIPHYQSGTRIYLENIVLFFQSSQDSKEVALLLNDSSEGILNNRLVEENGCRIYYYREYFLARLIKIKLHIIFQYIAIWIKTVILRPTIIVLSLPDPSLYSLMLCAILPNSYLIVHSQAEQSSQADHKNRDFAIFKEILKDYLSKKCLNVATTSYFATRTYNEKHGYEFAQSSLLPTFSLTGQVNQTVSKDIDLLIGNNGGSLVLTVGGCEDWKGIELWLKIVKYMNSYYKSTDEYPIFVWVGGGSMLLESREFLRHHSINNAYLLGQRSKSDIVRLYENSRLYLQTSKKESFGISAFHALQYSLPLIVTKKTALEDLCDENLNGIIINHIDSILEISERIEQLFYDKMLCHKYSRNSRFKYLSLLKKTPFRQSMANFIFSHA
jgi:hypothetical protein